MYGSWRWNLSFASIGLVVVFVIGLSNNPWLIALLRGGYSFIIFFILAYMVRYMVGMLLNHQAQSIDDPEQEDEQEQQGTQIDYVTPEGEEDLNEVLRKQMQQGNSAERAESIVDQQHAQAAQFQPLKPKKLVSTENIQAEDLTKAVRHLTGE